MIGLVVVGHAPFATTMLSCARHVYGEEPQRCVAIDVMPDADVASEVERGRLAVSTVDAGDGVLVFVDLFGATPGNVASQLALPGRVEVVAGVNLPMLLRTLCYRAATPLSTMVEKAIGGGASGIMKIASTSPQNQRVFPCEPDSAGESAQ